MYYDKQRYENLISESPLFSLDKEAEPSAYKREAYKMMEYLYCYLMAVNEKGYEPYACEIMEVSIRCISNFESSKGVFLHYFNAAWKQEYSHLMGDQIIDNKIRGIRITEEEKRNIRKYIKLAESKDTGCTREELYQRIAEAMQIPIEKVQLIAALSSLSVSGETIKSDDFKEISVWDQLSDGASIEEELSVAASIEDLLAMMDAVFTSLQNRQKPIVSDMITARIWPMISEQQSKSYSFISGEVLEICKKTGQAPTQRVIADKYGRDEASISRTINEFIKKLKNRLREV
ncbi:hypothetical protein [Macellibacteroides fermentans]|uniref:hypothetical protein n=1 Tax=Macellibacteroides fermentans TaxID=879969 RepID=UPI00406BED76